jgi:hypothetical protein
MKLNNLLELNRLNNFSNLILVRCKMFVCFLSNPGKEKHVRNLFFNAPRLKQKKSKENKSEARRKGDEKFMINME